MVAKWLTFMFSTRKHFHTNFIARWTFPIATLLSEKILTTNLWEQESLECLTSLIENLPSDCRRVCYNPSFVCISFRSWRFCDMELLSNMNHNDIFSQLFPSIDHIHLCGIVLHIYDYRTSILFDKYSRKAQFQHYMVLELPKKKRNDFNECSSLIIRFFSKLELPLSHKDMILATHWDNRHSFPHGIFVYIYDDRSRTFYCKLFRKTILDCCNFVLAFCYHTYSFAGFFSYTEDTHQVYGIGFRKRECYKLAFRCTVNFNMNVRSKEEQNQTNKTVFYTNILCFHTSTSFVHIE